jgi:hypothetical protein
LYLPNECSEKFRLPMRILIPVIIYLTVPIVGILAYLKIYRDLERKEIPCAPYIPIFILFFAYGGWLVLF